MANRELRVKLTAEVNQFKKQIAQSEKAISALKTTMIKAGGGTKQMKKELALLQTELKSLKSSAASAGAELRSAGGALGKGALTKNTRLLNQTAYALDDIQYGFRGVQNNLQQIAIQAGASGGVTLGLTAMLIALNYVIEHWEEFGLTASSVMDDINEAFAKEQGVIALTQFYAEVLKQTEEGTELNKIAVQKLKDAGWDPVKDVLDEFVELQKESLLLSALEGVIKEKGGKLLKKSVEAQSDLNKAIEAEKQARINAQNATDPEASGFYSGNITAARDAQKRARKTLSGIKEEFDSFIKNTTQTAKDLIGEGGLFEFLNPPDDDDDESGKKGKVSWLLDPKIIQQGSRAFDGYIERIRNIGLAKDELDFQKFQEDIEAVNALFNNGIITLDEYIDRLGNLSDAYEESGGVDKLNEKTKELTINFAEVARQMISAASSGKDVGKALLAGIGNTMVQLGSQLILVGLGIEAFKVSLAKLNGPAAIAAGVALVALGTTFANIAKSASGGGGSDNASQVAAASSAPLTIELGKITGSRGLRSSTTRGEDIRYNQQVARDNYAAYS